MNNTQLYLTIGVPTVTVILAWVSGQFNLNSLRAELRGEIRDLRSEIKGELRDIRSEMRDLRSEMNGLRSEVHGDMLAVRERVTKVESRSEVA